MEKMKKLNLIVNVFACLILNLKSISECHLNCGTLSQSTCRDDVTTKWNEDMVSSSLKKWMSSLAKIRSMPERNKKLFFLRKKVLDFEVKNKWGKSVGDGVQYIANIDCVTKKISGPTWRKTSISSSTIFHDGFLYGHENENGEMTGRVTNMFLLLCCFFDSS